jgi:6,7-dimethyl-8-ribityllumazine synthase
MAEFNGTPQGSGRRVVVVASRFNETVTRPLVDGALEALVAHEVAFDDIDVIWVPGAWELPLAARRALASGRYDALVALGAVVRGDTPHFDYVAGEAARGLNAVAVAHALPVGFGVLTVDTMQQAVDRAGGSAGNKGHEAAAAALQAADVITQLRAAHAQD